LSAAEFRGGVGAGSDGPQGELMDRTDARVAAGGQLDGDFVDHGVKSAEQEQRELSAGRCRHGRRIPSPAGMDNLVVDM